MLQLTAPWVSLDEEMGVRIRTQPGLWSPLTKERPFHCMGVLVMVYQTGFNESVLEALPAYHRPADPLISELLNPVPWILNPPEKTRTSA